MFYIISVGHLIISKLQLLLDEKHGYVLVNVHHGLLEVREAVFDTIFAFLVKNKGKNTCLTSYRVCKIQFFCLLRLHNFFIFHQIVKLCISN